jgi:hypothetical protein
VKGSVSFKDWLMFVSKIERKEPNYYERPNGIHGPSGRDAVKNSSTKTREHRSLTVRSPSGRYELREPRLKSRLQARPNAPREKNGESGFALAPSGRPCYRPDGPLE